MCSTYTEQEPGIVMKLFFAFISLVLEEAHFSALDPEFCEFSKLTRTVVKSCPTDAESWRRASIDKNCSSFRHKCTGKLEYHCVINPWQNVTVEVCAPSTRIRRGHCTEYNTRGGKLQEFYIPNCKACTEDYSSTDAYKYQECYSKIHNQKIKLKRGGLSYRQSQQLDQSDNMVYEMNEEVGQTNGGGHASRTDVNLFVTILQLAIVLYNRSNL